MRVAASSHLKGVFKPSYPEDSCAYFGVDYLDVFTKSLFAIVRQNLLLQHQLHQDLFLYFFEHQAHLIDRSDYRLLLHALKNH